MKIEAGKFYRTRDGHRARVYAVDGRDPYPAHGAIFFDGAGWIGNTWTIEGSVSVALHPRCYDLISEWVDKPVVDWSKMAAWHRWVAMDSDKRWYAFADEPRICDVAWHAATNSNSIPTAYYPTFSGDWKDSLVERPTV